MQDLIQVIVEQPERAEEFKGIVLSRELRDLPAAVREPPQSLAASVTETNGRLTNDASASPDTPQNREFRNFLNTAPLQDAVVAAADWLKRKTGTAEPLQKPGPPAKI